jgi:hypothetical protein
MTPFKKMRDGLDFQLKTPDHMVGTIFDQKEFKRKFGGKWCLNAPAAFSVKYHYHWSESHISRTCNPPLAAL